MKSAPTIVLAIESAIAGGSLSLLRDSVEIANWTGTDTVSKAEDLLFNIDAMLTAQNISRHEIGLIAVSAGPGSFTGIRIGIATALGLKTGLGIKMASQSALSAIAASQKTAEVVTVAVPVGRNAVCIQRFAGDIALDGPASITEDAFTALVRNRIEGERFLVHFALYERLEENAAAIDFGSNIAYTVGVACGRAPDVVTEPLFISKSF